jgi:cytoskeletal protein CcmA (bactofilin family)
MVRVDERFVVPAGEIIDDDLIIMADKSATIDGTVRGDVIVYGSDVTINGTIEGDLIGFGDRVWIQGMVQGDMRFGAIESITIDGEIGRSLNTLARRVALGPKGRVGGNWLALAESIDLMGEVGRGVLAAATNLHVSGRVARDVVINGTSVTVGSTAKITGELRVSGQNPPTVQPGASVGEVKFINVEPPVKRDPLLGITFFAVMRLVGFVLLGLLLAKVGPRFYSAFAHQASGRFWSTFGIGVALLVAVPVVAIILGVTVMGLPAAIMVIVPLYLAGMYVGQMLVAGWIGRLIFSRVRPEARISPTWLFLLGTILLTLLTRLPFLGFPIAVISLALALGGLAIITARWIGRMSQEV